MRYSGSTLILHVHTDYYTNYQTKEYKFCIQMNIISTLKLTLNSSSNNSELQFCYTPVANIHICCVIRAEYSILYVIMTLMKPLFASDTFCHSFIILKPWLSTLTKHTKSFRFYHTSTMHRVLLTWKRNHTFILKTINYCFT